jgi:pSer/pThr/pTyr-binding forkhead associated (FHA) protein
VLARPRARASRQERLTVTDAVTLHIESPAGARRRICLDDRQKLTIGRSTDCDLILFDPAVSRLHCVLYEDNGRWCVSDAASSGGVRVNGRRVLRRRLKEGDVISVGGARLWLDGLRRHGRLRIQPQAPDFQSPAPASDISPPEDGRTSVFLPDDDQSFDLAETRIDA